MWLENLKQPPFNPVAEESLLSCILIDNALFFECWKFNLSSSDFFDREYATIFGAMEELMKSWTTIDPVTLATRMKIKDDSRLFDLATKLLTTKGFEEFAQAIKEDSIKRNLLKKLKKASISCHESSLEDVQGAITDLSLNMDAFSKEKDFKQSLYDFYEDLCTNADWDVIKTWFKEIDGIIKWWRRGQLITIAGRPWMGKSAVMLSIALEQSKENKVAFFNLEMTSKEIALRLVSNYTEIPYSTVDSGKKHWKEWQEGDIADAFWFIKNSGISVYDKMTYLHTIIFECRRLKASQGLDVVYIDYVQLLDGKFSDDNRALFLSKIIRELKQLAKELDVTVVIGSQLSREIEKRRDPRPKLADLRESGSIEQDSDAVIFLNRDEDTTAPKNDNISQIMFIIGKFRNGRTWEIPLSFNWPCMKLLDVLLEY